MYEIKEYVKNISITAILEIFLKQFSTRKTHNLSQQILVLINLELSYFSVFSTMYTFSIILTFFNL